jgi:DNA-binding winged helix-turn-helix (wHTH) protein
LNLLATAVGLRSELRAVRAALERQAERLDRMEHDLSVVIEAARAAGESVDLSPLGHLPMAYSFNCHCNADDSAEFQIDGSEYFRLPPRLSQVLLFLKSAPKCGEDDLVAWRSREDLLEFLRGQTGRKIPARYINNIVHLLKNAFQKKGLDRRLIQTHERKGVRLALKYLAAQVIEGGQR